MNDIYKNEGLGQELKELNIFLKYQVGNNQLKSLIKRFFKIDYKITNTITVQFNNITIIK